MYVFVVVELLVQPFVAVALILREDLRRRRKEEENRFLFCLPVVGQVFPLRGNDLRFQFFRDFVCPQVLEPIIQLRSGNILPETVAGFKPVGIRFNRCADEVYLPAIVQIDREVTALFDMFIRIEETALANGAFIVFYFALVFIVVVVVLIAFVGIIGLCGNLSRYFCDKARYGFRIEVLRFLLPLRLCRRKFPGTSRVPGQIDKVIIVHTGGGLDPGSFQQAQHDRRVNSVEPIPRVGCPQSRDFRKAVLGFSVVLLPVPADTGYRTVKDLFSFHADSSSSS